MNKYFYYNYFTVAFANLLLFVPYVLIQNRYNGTVLAIGFGFIIGIALLYLFVRASQVYPEKDVMDIIDATKQKWFFFLFVPAKTLLSITSSLLVVGGYAVIVLRYLNPDGNIQMIVLLVLLAVGYVATRKKLSVAYVIEFMIIFSVPFIIFIIVKTFMNPLFTFDSVRAVSNHYMDTPNLLTLAAATFMFSGFSNLPIFLQSRNVPLKFRYCWPAPVITLALLIVTVMIPIGVLGSETAAEYYFVWTVASDATQIPYGFIERLMFIFIIVLLSIAITYTAATFSQVIIVCKKMIDQFRKNKSKNQSNNISYYIYGVLALCIFFFVTKSNDMIYEKIAMWYLVIHFLVEVSYTIIFFIIVKVKGNKAHDTKNY